MIFGVTVIVSALYLLLIATNTTKIIRPISSVQMPALVHLTRLGYTYYGRIFEDMADEVYDPDTNILKDVFISQFKKLTSMCSLERLLFILKYGIAYVNMEREVDGKIETINQKHIMRYQQMFAAFAIREKLSESVKSGVVWHTQGSGKTAS